MAKCTSGVVHSVNVGAPRANSNAQTNFALKGCFWTISCFSTNCISLTCVNGQYVALLAACAMWGTAVGPWKDVPAAGHVVLCSSQPPQPQQVDTITVELLERASTTETPPPPPLPPPRTLGPQLEALLLSGERSDVGLLPSDGPPALRAHSFVLCARSSVFAAQLLGPLAAGDMERVATGVSRDTLAHLLQFFYTDDVPVASLGAFDSAAALLEAADFYGAARCVSLCSAALSRAPLLTPDTAAACLLLADTHGCSELLSRVLVFAAAKAGEVLATPSWGALSRDRPQLVASLLHTVVFKSPPLGEARRVCPRTE